MLENREKIGSFNLYEILRNLNLLSENKYFFNGNKSIEIEKYALKITIYANPKNVKKVYELTKNYRSIIDIYIEEDYGLNDTIKIKINDDSYNIIERQIP